MLCVCIFKTQPPIVSLQHLFFRASRTAYLLASIQLLLSSPLKMTGREVKIKWTAYLLIISVCLLKVQHICMNACSDFCTFRLEAWDQPQVFFIKQPSLSKSSEQRESEDWSEPAYVPKNILKSVKVLWTMVDPLYLLIQDSQILLSTGYIPYPMGQARTIQRWLGLCSGHLQRASWHTSKGSGKP